MNRRMGYFNESIQTIVSVQYNSQLEPLKLKIGCADQMEFTMLRQICRRGRIKALVADGAISTHGYLQAFYALLQPEDSLSDNIAHANFLKTKRRGRKLNITEYEQLLDLVNAGLPSPTVRHHHSFPHPMNAVVLPQFVTNENSVEHKGRSFSPRVCHEGKSCIQYFTSAALIGEDTGFIETIFQLTIGGVLRTFLIISPHLSLSIMDQARDPFLQRPRFKMKLVYAQSSNDKILIELRQVGTHLAMRRRPAGTFGISQPVMILHWLDRGRV